MSEYTPTDDQLRDIARRATGTGYYSGGVKALRAVWDAARAGVVAEEPEWEYGEQSKFDPNTVWVIDRIGQPMIWEDIPDEKRVRRRAAGPWVPLAEDNQT